MGVRSILPLPKHSQAKVPASYAQPGTKCASACQMMGEVNVSGALCESIDWTELRHLPSPVWWGWAGEAVLSPPWSLKTAGESQGIIVGVIGWGRASAESYRS